MIMSWREGKDESPRERRNKWEPGSYGMEVLSLGR
jgi:hypothetical protein